MALIRYPGSKAKLAEQICRQFPPEMTLALWSDKAGWEYREPFFGAGAIGFSILDDGLARRCSVWLNDIDPGMCALWTAVKDHPDCMYRMIEKFTPSPDLFYQYKEEDGRRDLNVVHSGFRKLALHRMSYSGLGAMSGGPLGGRDQSSKYNVDCRWNPERIRAEIRSLSIVLGRFKHLKITNLDFAEVIRDAPETCFIYADPPYFEKGPELYKHSMSDADHARLAALLRETKATWVLSYDEHPAIREHYHWANFEQIELKYTTAFSKGSRPKNREVIITP
jgi:DNA adenine methylase